MKTSKVLRAAANLIEERGWTQGASAKSKTGRIVLVKSRSAACFCSSGAIERAARTGNEERSALLSLGATILASNVPKYIHRTLRVVAWNDEDGRTKAQVLEMIERAARNSEKEGD